MLYCVLLGVDRTKTDTGPRQTYSPWLQQRSNTHRPEISVQTHVIRRRSISSPPHQPVVPGPGITDSDYVLPIRDPGGKSREARDDNKERPKQPSSSRGFGIATWLSYSETDLRTLILV